MKQVTHKNSLYGIFDDILTGQKTHFSIKDFLSKSDQIRWKLRIWSYLLEISLMENFIFCAVTGQHNDSSPSL